MSIFYIVLCGLAFLNLLLFVFRFDGKKLNNYLFVVVLLLAISNAGYLALAYSTELNEATLALKISEAAGCYMPLVLMIAILEMCKIKMPKFIVNILFLLSISVYIMILTAGYTDWYFKDLAIESIYNVTVLNYNYGIMHSVYYLILYGYLFIILIILIYTLVMKHSVSQKNIWTLMALVVINSLVFLSEQFWIDTFEIIPVVYVIDGFILVYLARRITLYNIEDNVAESLAKQKDYGYIMFDNHFNYIGSNSVALQIFSGLKKCKIDLPIKEELDVHFFVEWLENEENEKKHEVDKDGLHYVININRIWHRKKAVGYTLEIKDDTANYKYLKLINKQNNSLENKVKTREEHIQSIQNKILFGMANMVENRDDNTGGHIKRTSDVIGILIDSIRKTKAYPLKKKFYTNIINAAPMHDLGKIGIDDIILRKPGRLTNEEFDIMKTHAEKSAHMVESILRGVEEEHFVNVAVNIAKHHHEKWNGMGYPNGLKGEEIPLEARIMAVADVYDALVSKRCYKDPMSFEEAYKVMVDSMGTHFDPNLLPAFEHARPKLEAYYTESKIE